MQLDDAINSLESCPAAYVLAGSDQQYLYKGACRDLARRMKDHRAGRVSRTKNRRPLALVYFEYFNTYTDARKRELFLKTGAGRHWLMSKLAGTTNFPP